RVPGRFDPGCGPDSQFGEADVGGTNAPQGGSKATRRPLGDVGAAESVLLQQTAERSTILLCFAGRAGDVPAMLLDQPCHVGALELFDDLQTSGSEAQAVQRR